MNLRKILPMVAVSLLAAYFGPMALASSGQTMANGRSVYGIANATAAADRTVDVSSATTLNVTCGETVTFLSGGHSFTWRFDVRGHRPFDLKQVAPAGFPLQRLMIYVSPNDLERG